MTGRTRAGVVRGYTLTDGQPDRPALDDASLLQAAGDCVPAGLPAHARRVVELCSDGVLAVADVAMVLALPSGVVRAIVSALVDDGHLVTRRPFVPAARPTDRALLERLLGALQRI